MKISILTEKNLLFRKENAIFHKTKRKHGNPIMTENTQVRVNGKSHKETVIIS
jgi:hypothetical protein